MKKRIGRRLVSLLLTVVTILTMLPAMTLPALADKKGHLEGLTNKAIELNFNGSKNDPWEADDQQITGSIKGIKGKFGFVTNYRSTLTIKNKTGTKAKLSFNYTVAVNGGTINVGNRSADTPGGNVSTELEKDGSIEVYIKSGSAEAPTKITMTDIKLVPVATATVTFQPTENGSYTVDGGKPITEPYTHTQRSTTAYEVTATPDSGYQFMDWYDVTNKKSISRDQKTELNIEKDCTIKARFTTSGLALFETGGLVYDDLTDAITAASGNSSALITQVGDGTISGSYTIPNGVTLLIPFNKAGTVSNGEPKFITSYVKPSTFRELTMTEGSTLTVNGELVVGGRLSAAGTSDGFSGTPTGPHGAIIMPEGSAIIVKGKLYAYGYISGPKDSTGKYTSGFNCGTVTVNSGGEVHEAFQIKDFRGGSVSANLVTSPILGGNSDKRIFPFSQYYVQNIEVPLTIHSGARDYAYSAVYALNNTNPTGAVCFIGNSGLFNVTEGYITRTYVAKAPEGSTLLNDHVYYDVYGKIAMNSIKLKIADYPISVEDYDLPINGNLSLRLFEHNGTGSEAVVNTPLALLPGFELYISKNSTLTVNKPIFVYDAAEWSQGKYVNSTNYYKGNPVLTYTKASRGTTQNPAPSAQIDINGTLTTSTGGVYTTDTGANICSSEGSGKFVQTNKPSTKTKTYQATQEGNKITGCPEIPITAAKLKNADGADKPYTETKDAKAGDTFTYCTCTTCGGGKWTNTNDLQVAEIVGNNGTQGKTYSTLEAAVKAYLPNDNIAPTNYIKLLHNTTEDIKNITKDIYLDLNGRTVTGDISVTGANKLYGMDSTAGKDYVTAPSGKIVGTVTGCAPTYQTPGDTNDRYVAILSEENGTSTLSFHRFNISVTGYRFELAAPQCALFFIGKFQGDDAAKKYLTSLGFTLKGEDDRPLGEDNYELPADKDIPPEAEPGDSPVVRSGDAFLFEVYLKRSFEKDKPAAYTEKIKAIAQATFKNNVETQDSKPQQLSFKDAWTDPKMVITPEQKTILENFKAGLGITD